MMTIQEIEEEIINEFKNLDDWMDKYKHLIRLGKSLSPMDSKYIKKDYLVKDCQLTTWLYSTFKDGKVFYDIDSSSVIIKGMIVLLKRTLSGRKPEDIINADLYFIDKIGLKESCAPARISDLLKLINKIKQDAVL
ncbi:MAG: SufE family protein, partial [Candidatus Nealsonbacteria bacterium]|nr:SufE family protein [Candidatus Nealsonbacteria bacterium]